MTFYLAHRGTEEDFFGVPFPTAGARVVFDIERLFAARDRDAGRPVKREIVGDEGLVVDEDPLAVLVLPDRLWRVSDIEDPIRLLPTNRWVRCRALTVREELPNWLVMGPHGNRVAQIIHRARDLTDQQARAIAALDPAEEERLVRAVWEAWLADRQSGSPVGCGSTEVYRAVEEAARRTDPHLFGWDDQDGVEVLTDPAWQQAGQAAVAAALGLGAPNLLGAHDSQRLAHRWQAVIQRPPT